MIAAKSDLFHPIFFTCWLHVDEKKRGSTVSDLVYIDLDRIDIFLQGDNIKYLHHSKFTRHFTSITANFGLSQREGAVQIIANGS